MGANAASTACFERHRPAMLAMAYRMLGDMGRAEELVQEAWLRWEGREDEVHAPRAYLVRIVTRLCLNELDSARARREEPHRECLPEPIALDRSPLHEIERAEEISMALLVALQRLAPAERAVLLLSEVFDFRHAEIADLVGKSQGACRQILRRARQNIALEKRALAVPREEHRALLRAFLEAARAGNAETLARLLADDAVLAADAGPDGGHYGRVRELPGPIQGGAKIAAFIAAVAPQGARGLVVEERSMNGQPAALLRRNGAPTAALMVSIGDGRIQRIFIQADARRLGRVR